MFASKKLYLIRHAESYNNIETQNYHYDSTLTNLGKKQSVHIAMFLDDNIDLIIHSKLTRTKETADFTIQRFFNATVQQWCVQEFNYLGENNATIIEKQKRKHNKKNYWSQKNPNYRFNDQAESFFDFLDRVESFVTKIIESNSNAIVVFSHKYFIKGVLWHSIMNNTEKYYSVKDFYDFCNLYSLDNANIVPCFIIDKSLYFSRISNK